jgi:acyl carrier protein
VGKKMEAEDAGATVQDRIHALVLAILRQNAITSELHSASRLVDVGLNSTDMVDLMLAIEAAFDFEIPPAEITRENFESIRTLELMTARQLSSAGADDRRSAPVSG